MPVVLARVDDRLIHGQVTVGWSQQLNPDRILLANNAIAGDAWQCRVYGSSVPPHIEVSFLSLSGTVLHLSQPEHLDEKTLLLTATVEEMAELARLGAPLADINLGGLHFAAGKQEMLSQFYLDRGDLAACGRLLGAGHGLFAQMVPGGHKTEIDRRQLAEMEDRL